MNKKNVLLIAAAGFLMLGCDHETRKGQLVLSGSTPVRITDEGGKAVEFVNGGLKVDFRASNDRKFTVELEQGDRKAKFSGRVPESSDWNFALRGQDIGQAVDFASNRSVEYYGPRSTAIGSGNSCGFNGTWVTEEEWQKCNEDWKVSFSDAKTSQSVGSFSSRIEGQSCLVGIRNLYCRERHEHEPFPHGGRNGRWSNALGTVKDLSEKAEAGVKFD